MYDVIVYIVHLGRNESLVLTSNLLFDLFQGSLFLNCLRSLNLFLVVYHMCITLAQCCSLVVHLGLLSHLRP
jgi:hypothetical protein